MPTIIRPDLASEEGKKLASYQPGQNVVIHFTVSSASGNELIGEVTQCEEEGAMPEEEGGEYESEAPAPTESSKMMGGKMPKAVVIVSTGAPKR